MKSETTNITINMQIWFQIVFESRNLFILSEELQIFFHMKSETTNIALNKKNGHSSTINRLDVHLRSDERNISGRSSEI